MNMLADEMNERMWHGVKSELPCPHEIPTPSLQGYHVLVVDDEKETLNYVSLALRRVGAKVTIAHSADEALSMLDLDHYHALLSDIGMPDGDGYYLIRHVRGRRGATGRIPAIAFTAFNEEEDLARVLAAGFQSHLAKPIEAAYLVAAVADVIEGSNLRLSH